MKQLKENSENMLDTPRIHIDNTGHNNDNMNNSMTITNGSSVMLTQDKHIVITPDEYTVEQI